ncbi:hypothetical protein ADUPG1_010031, partial [Aduncisulcus paluster]
MFELFVNLEFLSINDTQLPDPDLLSTNTGLVELHADENGWYSVYPLRNHEELEVLSLKTNNISDPSPLYKLKNTLTTLDLTDNLICGSGVAAAIDLKLGGTDIATSTITSACACGSTFDTSDTIGLNKVCIETKPGSDTWFITCASDSYSTYTDADTFTCTRPLHILNNCIGGCEYGQECRNDGFGLTTQGRCLDVISDENLHTCVGSLFFDKEHVVSSSVYSVASLKTLDTSIDSEVILSCSNQSVSSIIGIEHLGKVTNIDVSYNNIDDLEAISLLTYVEVLNLSGSDINNDLFDEYIAGLSFITQLLLADTSVNDISTLPASQLSSLTSLALGNNGRLSEEFIFTTLPSLIAIESLDLSGCYISDVSPLYHLPNLVSLDISSNRLCGGKEGKDELKAKFVNASTFTTFIYGSQTCKCSSSFTYVNGFSDNKACVETRLGSETWKGVCASNSYAVYDSASTYSCIDLFPCDGGCTYGEACRLSDDGDSSECMPVIVDDGLRSYIAENLIVEEDKDSSVSPALFSVSSLKNIPSSAEVVYSSSSFSDLRGLEHLVQVSSINLSGNTFIDDVSLLSSLTNLQKLDLSECSLTSSISELENLTNLTHLDLSCSSNNTTIVDYDISGFTSLTNIVSFKIAGFTKVATLPPFSHIPPTLQILDISNTSIDSILNIYSQATSILELYATGVGWYDVFEVINCVNVTTLDLQNNFIADPSKLYELKETLSVLDLGENPICGMDSAGIEEFSSHFTNISSFAFDDTYCSCTPDSFSYSNNIVCSNLWTDGIWSPACYASSYRNVEVQFTTEIVDGDSPCISIDPYLQSDIYDLCSGLKEENKLCIGIGTDLVIDDLEIVCSEGWYGDNCDSECPVDRYGTICGSGNNSGCDYSTHTCVCSDGYTGDLCDVKKDIVFDGIWSPACYASSYRNVEVQFTTEIVDGDSPCISIDPYLQSDIYDLCSGLKEENKLCIGI